MYLFFRLYIGFRLRAVEDYKMAMKVNTKEVRLEVRVSFTTDFTTLLCNMLQLLSLSNVKCCSQKACDVT